MTNVVFLKIWFQFVRTESFEESFLTDENFTDDVDKSL